MEAHACNRSTWDVEGESSEVGGQSRLHETLSQPPFLSLVLKTREGTTQRMEKKKAVEKYVSDKGSVSEIHK